MEAAERPICLCIKDARIKPVALDFIKSDQAAIYSFTI